MILNLESEAIKVARTKIGVTEDPPGSNRGTDVDMFLAIGGGLDAKNGKYAWCAAYVSWAIIVAGQNLGLKPRFRRSSRALGLLEKNQDLILPAPLANCVGVMDHDGIKGHAFFVYALDLSNPGNLYTLEGNSDAAGSRTGGSVVLRERRVEDCAGFIQIA